MRLITITKDILTVTEGIIGQQVNTQGIMADGLARRIGEKWPIVPAEFQRQGPKLGEILCVPVGIGLFVCSIVGQTVFNSRGCLTNYAALDHALRTLSSWARERKLPVYLPYALGCGLSDWPIVEAIIDEAIPEAILCRWPA